MELRLPAFQWYTPLWAATEAMLAGCYEDAERLSAEAEDAGMRAGDRNAGVFAGIVRFCSQLEREAFGEMDVAFVEDKIANSPAGSPTAADTPGCSPDSARPSAPANSSTRR